MSVRWLSRLIAASEDRTAQAGDNFSTDVDGAAAGVLMTDYILDNWINWASSDYNSTTIFASGTTLHFTFDFQAHPRYVDIRPIPAVLSAELVDNISFSPTGASVSLVTVWDTAGLYTTCTVAATLTGANDDTPGTFENLRLIFRLPQDTGNFNDLLQQIYDPVKLATVYTPSGPSLPTAVPQSLSITAQAGAVRGDWLNTNDSLNTIRIEWQKWDGSTWQAYSSHNLAANTTNHTETGLTAGWLMRYRVIYYNVTGDSTGGYATSGSATVLTPPSAPTETPSSPTMANMGGSVGRASWVNTNSTDQIAVQFYKDSSPFGAEQQLPANSTQADQSGYGSSTEGTFDVWYFNGAGSGPVASGGPAFF